MQSKVVLLEFVHYKYFMKKIVWAFLLGLVCLNFGWASVDHQDKDQLKEEETLNYSIDDDETETQKFSNLVKSTMDLMGPENLETEKSDTVSQATTP